jgi:hypothetical protein
MTLVGAVLLLPCHEPTTRVAFHVPVKERSVTFGSEGYERQSPATTFCVSGASAPLVMTKSPNALTILIPPSTAKRVHCSWPGHAAGIVGPETEMVSALPAGRVVGATLESVVVVVGALVCVVVTEVVAGVVEVEVVVAVVLAPADVVVAAVVADDEVEAVAVVVAPVVVGVVAGPVVVGGAVCVQPKPQHRLKV